MGLAGVKLLRAGKPAWLSRASREAGWTKPVKRSFRVENEASLLTPGLPIGYVDLYRV